MQTPRPDLHAVLSALTPRERQIVAYVAAGRPNKVIAIDLGISLRTVESHRARIFTKLRARNAMQLACRLCAHGRSGASPVLGITQEDPLLSLAAPPAWAAAAPVAAHWLHEPQDARAGYAARAAPAGDLPRTGTATGGSGADAAPNGQPGPDISDKSA